MNPGINFEDADDDLKRLGTAVVAFMRELSESADGDVESMLIALQHWGVDPGQMTVVDVAVFKAVMASLRIRLNHTLLNPGPASIPAAAAELLALDTTGMRRH